MNRTLRRAREALDARLAPLRPAERFMPPPRGWVRAIRNALGMSGPQLARRMAVSPQAVAALEQSEATGTIRLNALRKAADALDCQLVWALVPNSPLESMAASRARAMAIGAIGGVAHSMAMEDQAVRADDLEDRIGAFITETLRDRDLWDET